MIKFSHSLFALPFALTGALLAARADDGTWRLVPLEWLASVACMVTARSAAMGFNRLVDRHIDAQNPRTASRHLPSGRLSVASVRLFTAASAALFVAATALFLPRNPWPLALSLPVLAWLLAYSYAKRFTALAHFWLGASLALAPVAAWIALRAGLAPTPLLLAAAVLVWVAGFDIIYALQDEHFDRAAGLRSIPARLGARRALHLARACHLLTVLFLALVGFAYPLGPLYFTGVAAVAVVLLYEHMSISPDDLSRLNLAFFWLNIGISLGVLAVTAADLLLTAPR
jgi:4-hydroxybenzoate polyprenyltransferase